MRVYTNSDVTMPSERDGQRDSVQRGVGGSRTPGSLSAGGTASIR